MEAWGRCTIAGERKRAAWALEALLLPPRDDGGLCSVASAASRAVRKASGHGARVCDKQRAAYVAP